MPLTSLTPTGSVLDVGDTWRPVVLVSDGTYGYATSGTVTATVTRPDGTTTAATVTSLPGPGLYAAAYVLAAAGRHTMSVSVSGTDTAAETFAVEAMASSTLPTLADVKTYLAGDAGSWTDAEITDALTAETSAQARVCRVGAVYPPDLRQALLRRVQRNLAMRGLLQEASNPEVGGLPARDPEVRRLEAPYRRLVVA
jgi:hypothetical protein